MEYKINDTFLLEVVIIGEDEDEYYPPENLIKIKFKNNESTWVTSEVLKGAEKTKPKYENRQWYWAQRTESSAMIPWYYCNGAWSYNYNHDGTLLHNYKSYKTENMFLIGNKIEKPQE